jgi:hypothetical protein
VTAQQADVQHRSFASMMATAHPDQWSQADDPALSASTVWTVRQEVERVLAEAERGRSFTTLDGRHLPIRPLDGLKGGSWSDDPHVDLATVLEELRMLRMEVKDLKRSVANHTLGGAEVKDAVTTIKEECPQDPAGERTERVATVDVVVRTVAERNPAYWTTGLTQAPPRFQIPHADQVVSLIRRIDSLVHHLPRDGDDPVGRRQRSNDDVFSPDNLVLLSDTLEGWECVVRGRETSL